jgi:phage baseplate assembly protein W
VTELAPPSTGDFLGRGWAFPVGVDVDGDVAMVADAEDIQQSIRLILETDPGERVMRPDYGAGLRRLLFEPITTNTLAMVQHRVQDALVQWEPRIDVVDVVVSADEAALGRLLIRIDYQIRATNTFYNLVYPFYLQEAG